MQEKTAKMEVRGQEIIHQINVLKTEVARAQEKSKEQDQELERKYCDKQTEHHEWLTDLKRRNEAGTKNERGTTRRKPGRNGEKYAIINSEWHGRFCPKFSATPKSISNVQFQLFGF